MTGPESSASVSLFGSIAESANLEGRTILIPLSSGQSSNLKTALKYINQCALSQNIDSSDDSILVESRVSKCRWQLMS